MNTIYDFRLLLHLISSFFLFLRVLDGDAVGCGINHPNTGRKLQKEKIKDADTSYSVVVVIASE